jgi:hypothetical protein
MSTDLLNYCLEQLAARPRALNIRVPMAQSAQNSFTRFWSKARFEVQQQSILTLLPDDPLYGKGYLYHYELVWHESQDPDAGLHLRIEFNLNTPAAPRELILLASVSESPIPFVSASGASLPKSLFNATKSRMLGRENKRAAGAVLPALRPGVATVQYLCQGGTTAVGSVSFPDMVDTEK